MNVGYVILGRPWLYDRDVTIYGWSNMCQFEYEEKKIKLLSREPKVEPSEPEPSEPKPTAVKKNNTISLITVKAFSQDLKKGNPFVILATKEFTKETNTIIPPRSLQ